jgi:hypothetical protein
VEVEASNSAGSDTQPFTIDVTEPPTITSAPITTASVGQPYTYDVEATGNPLPTYALLEQPPGMTINPQTGVISWTPTTSGTVSVEVEASNSAGSDTQPFTIKVSNSATEDSIKIYLPIVMR